jgi:hypothetical protein
VSDRSAVAAAHSVDLAAVSFGRPASAAVTNGERRLEDVVSFGWGRAVIVKAPGGGCGIHSLRNECRDVDDPHALVDAGFHVIAHSHWRGRSRRRAVDAHMSAAAGRGCTRAGLGDPHGMQPQVDSY